MFNGETRKYFIICSHSSALSVTVDSCVSRYTRTNYMFQYNPPVPCGLFFTKTLDESIFHFRGSYLACILFKEKCTLRFANSADLSQTLK